MREAPVSTTDPEARMMKMPDGGFRPAYNVQLATDVASQVIVGVAVSNQGTDQAESSAFIGGEGLPMEEHVAQRTGRHPEAYLVDGGFVDLEDIGTLERRGVQVYAPPKRRPSAGRAARGYAGSLAPRQRCWRGGSAWKPEDGQAIYRHRASTAECVNALARAKYGVRRFTLKGVAKVSCVVLLMAITHNLLRWSTLSG